MDVARRVRDSAPGRAGFIPNMIPLPGGLSRKSNSFWSYGIPYVENVFGGRKKLILKDPIEETRQTHVKALFGENNNPLARQVELSTCRRC